jgi:hypothetical protein
LRVKYDRERPIRASAKRATCPAGLRGTKACLGGVIFGNVIQGLLIIRRRKGVWRSVSYGATFMGRQTELTL